MSKSVVVLPTAYLKQVSFGFTSCIARISGMRFSDHRDKQFILSNEGA